MRKLVRSPEPEFLQANSAKWNQRWSELRQQNPSANFAWYQLNGKTVREWLIPIFREMNQGHCTFCDSFPLEGGSKEPIEHFRPKSDQRFYHLTYAWPNLYYSCEACQSSKREQWDDLLIAPDEEGYRFQDYFMFDFITGAIKENPLASQDMQERAKCTIQLYGLDSPERRRMRKLDLDKWRATELKEINLWAFRDYLETSNYPEVKI